MASLAVTGLTGVASLSVGKACGNVKIKRGLSSSFYGSAVSFSNPKFSIAKNSSQRRSLNLVRSAASAASADVSTLPKSSDEESAAASKIRFTESGGSMKRLKTLYEEEVVPTLMKELGYSNRFQIPKLEKIVVNCGVGDASQNAKALDGAKKDLSIATGQQPVVTRAKKAIAGFKVREDMVVGLATTLRGELMYSFIDRLANLVLPRMRDFGGLNKGSFDGNGNFSLGLKEQTLFPEIAYDQIDKTRGMDITIVTSASSDREAKRLLELLGLKFRETSAAATPVSKPKKKKFNRR